MCSDYANGWIVATDGTWIQLDNIDYSDAPECPKCGAKRDTFIVMEVTTDGKVLSYLCEICGTCIRRDIGEDK